MLRLVIACFLLCSLFGVLYAQPALQFQNFTQSEGLASDYVICILEAYHGFIWIGTENGLNRFDGKHFLRFSSNPEDSTTLDDNWVTEGFDDRHHNPWVGTRYGVHRLDRETGNVTRIPLIKDQQKGHILVNDITEDPQGNIWINSPEEGLLDQLLGLSNLDVLKTATGNAAWPSICQLENSELEVRRILWYPERIQKDLSNLIEVEQVWKSGRVK